MNDKKRISPVGMLGMHHTEEAKQKIRTSHLDSNNAMWRGDKVGYAALHSWVKRRLVKPELCQCCDVNPPIDLANKGTYDRNLENWEWLCRRCHMIKDGRIKNLNIGLPFGEKNPNWKGGLSHSKEYFAMKAREYRKTDKYKEWYKWKEV